jgi:hypothetical protein
MPPKKPSPARELFEVIVGALDRAEAELSPSLYERLLEKVGLRVDARLEDLLGDDEDLLGDDEDLLGDDEDLLGDDEDDGEEDDLADEEEEDA